MQITNKTLTTMAKADEMPISVYQAPYKIVQLHTKNGIIEMTNKEIEWLIANKVWYIWKWKTLYQIMHSVNAGYYPMRLCDLSVHTLRGRYIALTASEVNRDLIKYGAVELNEQL